MRKTARTTVPVHPLLAERWSPRGFDRAHEIGDEALAALLEAARWAPSAGNSQPWRFLVTRRGEPAHDRLYAALAPGNQALGLYGNSPLVGLFSLREVTFPAWTLAAFAIGALAGMLIRRVVPAIVATLAVYTGLVFATAAFFREHYLTPLVTSSLTFNLPGASTRSPFCASKVLKLPLTRARTNTSPA